MNKLSMDFSRMDPFISQAELKEEREKHKAMYSRILESEKNDGDQVLGWMDLEEIANDEVVLTIEKKAEEVRADADLFILIGVGGSNQGARAIIKALQTDGPDIIYSGNNLSPKYMKDILDQMEGKSVYVNVIAKNFATLEPGLCFRMIRQRLEKTYGLEGAAKRIIATGSPGGSSLEVLAKDKGYLFLPFPIPVGGRFSVLSPVGLFPIAVAGIDLKALIQGGKDMKASILTEKSEDADVLTYSIVRNKLYNMGYAIELLTYFEPSLAYFSKWWIQLFGESEGKDDKSVFPSAASFSEDLHSLGQWIQSGKKNLFETFVNIKKPLEELIVEPDESSDYFDYLDGKDFHDINQIAFKATLQAHSDGNIPCMTLEVPELNAYYFGQMFYFYEMACYTSASILGVNPFDQPGVEAYKHYMFESLKQ